MCPVKAASIYIHIPFCVRKCLYCDFASQAGRQSDFGRYCDAVKAEARSAYERYGKRDIPSVFIGGGTPTVVPAELLCSLLEEVFRLFPPGEGAEITTEANPGTVTLEQLRLLRAAGVNRISFGAQSFDSALLRTLGRIHTPSDITKAIETAREAGFENINLDLMYALPGQTQDTWLKTLREAISLDIPHISCYSLILEEGTKLTERVLKGEISVPDDDTCLAMQKTAAQVLSRAGHERYEISNYAKPGMECRHNLRYWEGGDYLGLGCAAHSLMDNVRYRNDASIDGYLTGNTYLEAQELSTSDRLEEAAMLGTRMIRGIELAAFYDRFGIDFFKAYRTETLIANKLAVISDGFFRLTDAGLDVQDAAVLEMIRDL
ncbi:MAG: radical SAM family heme chaperone HemW [Clostridia bacterium]|nr:radical SAM family heme chaperone HemW [Clostridia bacterium]